MTNPTTEDLIHEVGMERDRQNMKWGTRFAGRDPNTWLAILLEEVGEVAEEIDPEALVVELVQVAAVALSWAEHVPTQGRTGTFPEGQIFRLEAMQLGDRAKALLEERFS